MSVRRLFVYGTLRRGFPNHHELAGAEFSGEALTEARYAVVECEGYPALVSGEQAITGEVYLVGAALLARLDAFEGDGYVRASVRLADGTSAEAYFSVRGVE